MCSFVLSRGVSVLTLTSSPSASMTESFWTVPTRILGPCRSCNTVIPFPSASATSRTVSTRSRCSSWVPCEKFIRATSIPAATRRRSVSGSVVAGPSVQTIFVRRSMLSKRVGRQYAQGGACASRCAAAQAAPNLEEPTWKCTTRAASAGFPQKSSRDGRRPGGGRPVRALPQWRLGELVARDPRVRPRLQGTRHHDELPHVLEG
jgi:hypothetical protein